MMATVRLRRSQTGASNAYMTLAKKPVPHLRLVETVQPQPDYERWPAALYRSVFALAFLALLALIVYAAFPGR